MTLSQLLSGIAYTGGRGLSTDELGECAVWPVKHLMALKLVYVDGRGKLVASIEKGMYPTINTRGQRDPRRQA